ncbi:hypothetical protein V5738_15625 [Salinisphaera sp. SPP-AMP-43]|uniref:hypothetical protein n=1 Tax=Salinisphaera sp. SPP-AMP-43 TaxID=3121288 RepID=UPI003C6E3E72
MATETVSVLTGDIVKSTALHAAQRDAVMAALEDTAGIIAGWPTAVRYERFRGDGWQLWLAEPKWTLRAALFARAGVRAACDRGDTRIAAGLGAAELGATLAASTGAAFERSGRGLERLKPHQLWYIDGKIGSTAEQALLRGLFGLCDERSRHWTARQADIFRRLGGPKAPLMAEVAEKLGVQPQTVQTHFTRAGGHALLEATAAFEEAMTS